MWKYFTYPMDDSCDDNYSGAYSSNSRNATIIMGIFAVWFLCLHFTKHSVDGLEQFRYGDFATTWSIPVESTQRERIYSESTNSLIHSTTTWVTFIFVELLFWQQKKSRISMSQSFDIRNEFYEMCNIWRDFQLDNQE